MRNDAFLLFYRRRWSGVGVPRIVASITPPAENAEVGTVAFVLSVANSPEGVTWAFTFGEGAPSAFLLNESDDTQGEVAEALDYETTQSYDIPIVATSDEDPATVLTRTIRIPVTNVIEAPVNLAAPVVTGTEWIGETLTCSTGTWHDMEEGSFSYQWFNADGDVELEGETANTLLIGAELDGESVYCTVTATNTAGSAAEDSNTVGPFEAAPGEDVALIWGTSNAMEWGSGSALQWGS